MKIEAPELPTELNFETLQSYKSAMRRWDQERIAAGHVTPHEVQEENALISVPRKVEVLHFPEAELLEP